MPIDPSIPLGVKPPAFNSPFEMLGQMQALQQQRQVIQSNQALEESRRQDIEKQRRLEAAQQKFYNIIVTSKTPDEVEARIKTEAPEMLAGYQKQRMELDEKAAGIKEKGLQASKLIAEIQAKGKEYSEPFMQLVEKSGHKPEVFDFALNTIQSHFPDFPADQYRQQAQGDPAKIKAIVDSLKSPEQQRADASAVTSAAELPGKVAESATRQQVLAGMRGGLTPDQLRQQAQSATTATETTRHNKSQEVLEGQRIAKTAATRFQSKDVLNDAGKPVMANFDAVSGTYTDPQSGQPIKNPKPVPSAQEMMDSRKFQKSAPVLSAIGELSEKINTGSGLLAKARGGAEKIAAKANYDDDVAEYQALVSGFTPLVARSLGHTGVLTQQDVDSVKELFPKPGDSKTLRDRKVKRLMGIIGELEGTEGVGGVAPKSGGIKILKIEQVP